MNDANVIAIRERAEVAYNKAVEDAIKNTLLFGGVLVVAVWFSNWAWVSRIAWLVVTLITLGDLIAVPSKIRAFRALQTQSTDPMTGRLHVGMIAAIVGGDVAMLALTVWSGFRVW